MTSWSLLHQFSSSFYKATSMYDSGICSYLHKKIPCTVDLFVRRFSVFRLMKSNVCDEIATWHSGSGDTLHADRGSMSNKMHL